jgi:hypothetical protein
MEGLETGLIFLAGRDRFVSIRRGCNLWTWRFFLDTHFGIGLCKGVMLIVLRNFVRSSSLFPFVYCNESSVDFLDVVRFFTQRRGYINYSFSSNAIGSYFILNAEYYMSLNIRKIKIFETFLIKKNFGNKITDVDFERFKDYKGLIYKHNYENKKFWVSPLKHKISCFRNYVCI